VSGETCLRLTSKRSRCLGVTWRCCTGVDTRRGRARSVGLPAIGLRRSQFGRLRSALHRMASRLAHRFRQAFTSDAGAMPWLRAQAALGVTQQAAKYPAHETANALGAGLARFLLAQAFLATQIERGMGALLVSVGVEVLDDFRSDGRIVNAAVETDPRSLFFERDRRALRACNTHKWQLEHGVLNENGERHLPPSGERKVPAGFA